MRFRAAVYGSDLNWGCRTLLLRMSEDMSKTCIVSVPRTMLAESLNCAEARISEWVGEAKGAGFLSVVKPGRPGRTAVYQGLVKVRGADPFKGYAETDTIGTPSGPLSTREGYAERVSTEVVQTATIGTDTPDSPGETSHRRGTG